MTSSADARAEQHWTPSRPRGLHGEGYRGHVFWDELFVLPLLTPHLPWVSRALLDYRHWRLDAARLAASAAELAGAMFPSQSGSDGREETPTQLYNPRSGRWMPDNSRRQLHPGLRSRTTSGSTTRPPATWPGWPTRGPT